MKKINTTLNVKNKITASLSSPRRIGGEVNLPDIIKGDKGDKGEDGVKGEDGIGIESVTVYYCVHDKNYGLTYDNASWGTIAPRITEDRPYIWMYVNVTYTNGRNYRSVPAVIGAHGQDGESIRVERVLDTIDNIAGRTDTLLVFSDGTEALVKGGTRGRDGLNGVDGYSPRVVVNRDEEEKKTVLEIYTRPNGGSIPMFQVVEIPDGSDGAKGDKGDKGEKGDAGESGKDGVSVTQIIPQYGLSASATALPAAWSNAPLTMSVTNKYLWCKVFITYDDNGTTTTTALTPVVIGAYGNTGQAISVASFLTEYQLTTNISIPPSTGWTIQPQIPSLAKPYLWVRYTTTFSNGTKAVSSPTIIGNYAMNGTNGKDYVLTDADKQEIADRVHVDPYDDTEIRAEIADKITKPESAPTVGKILKIKSVNEDGSFVCEWADDASGAVDDVQVNGSSVVTDGVANIGVADNKGTSVESGVLAIKRATGTLVKNGEDVYRPIVPFLTDYAAFYGLAKAAGDTTQSASSNAIGTYTDEAKEAIKGMLGISEGGSETSVPSVFRITEDMVTVETDATKGVAPYSTAYGYTNITIDDDSVEWVDGGIYTFVVNTKMVVNSANRNVRVRIGESGAWIPVFNNTAIQNGSTVFVKAQHRLFIFKKTYQSNGALHLVTDDNSTYAYLMNTIAGDSTSSPIVIDSAGYGARYSLIFPTTEDRSKWSSLVKSSATGTTKAVTALTYYAQDPLYIYSANVAAGAKPVNTLYQYFQGLDLRYTANTANTYLVAYDRAFLYMHEYDPDTNSFKADATNGGIVSASKLGTKWATTVTGDVYLYWLGFTTATWYQLNPLQTDAPRIWKYTPSTQTLVPVIVTGGGDGSNVSDVQIGDTTIVTDGVATIPYANASGRVGVMAIQGGTGLAVKDHAIYAQSSNAANIKEGTSTGSIIKPNMAHAVSFYGLAKAAGDTTMSTSSNAIGTYTDEAKTAIQTMLGIDSQDDHINELIDTKLDDYVIEHGFSGDWMYRKWNSGIAEIWGKFNKKTDGGSYLHFSNAYPFYITFPRIQGSALTAGVIASGVAYVNTSDTEIDVWAITGTTTKNVDCYLNTYTIGWWK